MERNNKNLFFVSPKNVNFLQYFIIIVFLAHIAFMCILEQAKHFTNEGKLSFARTRSIIRVLSGTETLARIRVQ